VFSFAGVRPLPDARRPAAPLAAPLAAAFAAPARRGPAPPGPARRRGPPPRAGRSPSPISAAGRPRPVPATALVHIVAAANGARPLRDRIRRRAAEAARDTPIAIAPRDLPFFY